MGNRRYLLVRACAGFSLVELLVALAIGVVLSFAVTHFLLRSKLSFLQSDELARLQENGAYALRLLSHELAMAGHLGSAMPGSTIATALKGSPCFDFLLDTASAIVHVNDVNTDGIATTGGTLPPRDCFLSRQHQVGTDILLVRRTSGTALVSAGQVRGAADAAALYLRSGDEGVAPSIHRGGSTQDRDDLWEYIPAMFFLRGHSRSRGDNIPTLCRKRPGRSSENMAPTECLVEGIENLQLEFGIDDDGDMQADRFERVPATAELTQAVAARVYLLVRSVHPIAGHRDDKSYLLAGKRIAAAHDSYYRRVMQVTVLLRNNAMFRW
ncbi:PilW family protein [Pseudomonadota bacterium]